MNSRHAFQILEQLGPEADRLGIKVVDVYGKSGPVAEFLAKIIHYIEAREAEIDRLQERESLWQWCAERTTETYGGCYRPEYAEKVRAAAKELAGDCAIERRE